MPDPVEAVQGKLVDGSYVRLVDGGGMGVAVVVLELVDRCVERQPFDGPVVDQLGPVDVHAAVPDHAAEPPQPVAGVVRRHASVHPVVPPVHAADQVRSLDAAVGEQRAPVPAPTREHAVLTPPTHRHEIDPIDKGRRRNAIGEIGPVDDLDRIGRRERGPHLHTSDVVHRPMVPRPSKASWQAARPTGSTRRQARGSVRRQAPASRSTASRRLAHRLPTPLRQRS